MASPRVGNITQELWQDTLNNLMNLSQATVKHNIELETRINELERELASWKQSYGVAVDSLNRQTSEYQTQVATLNKQLLDMDIFTKNNPLILCVINGDNTFFEHSLVSQGFSGGRIAATKLTKAIADFVFSEGTPVPNNVTFWVTLYFKKSNLTNVLVKNQFCTVDQLEAFLTGFTQSSQRFTSIDVGSGEEGSDVKIREYLQTFTQFPQTMRVFCTGCHDASYTSTLNGLSSDELLGKLVAIQSSADEIAEPSQYPIPTLIMDGLFISPPLPSNLAKRSPVPVGSFNTVVLNGGLISPQSPARPSRRLIDPNFPLHKQNPPPCNEYYLMTCSKGAGICKYSHDYVLTPDQLASLARNAKKAPCNWLKNGVQCPFGEKCCWGHVCPNGQKCIHLSKGKCWFRVDGMHGEM